MAKKNEFYEGIRDGMAEFIDALRANRPVRSYEVDVPEPKPLGPREITALRTKTVRASQRVFADLLNVAPQTVQAWEQGRALPTGASLRLLRMVKADPSILWRLVTVRPQPRGRKKRTSDRRMAV